MSQKTVKLIIDGKAISVQEGDTILKAARDNDIGIPTMCYLDGLSTVGGCRLCLVEAKDVGKLLPACTTPVSAGMDIITNSERLRNYRKMLVELLLSERTHVCAVCMANGSCELQETATGLGVDHVEVARKWTGHAVDVSHERFTIDPNRCILCTRCIRVCDEVEGVHTLDLKLRGIESMVIVDMDQPWGASRTCTSCAKCSAVCPVGAIYVKGKPLSVTKRQELPSFVLNRRRR